MSYNGSGTFVINSTGQPVVTGTVISSSTFNSLTADLGTGLSTAITKDGQTTTTAKIPFAQGISAAVASNFAAGTVGAPSIYLSTDTTTGLYRIGANNVGFAVSGVKLLDLSSALVGVTGALTVSTTLGVTGATTLQGLTVGLGAGAISTNTAVGYQALFSNVSSVNNVAIGYQALYSNTNNSNVAIGLQALYSNTTGTQNTAIGYQAIYSNLTGNYNVAIGLQALYSNTGNNNTGCGYNALTSNTSGSGNTALNPNNSAGAYAPVFDPTTHSNRFCMGSTGVTNAYIQVAWTVVSDARDKTDFAPVPHGLDFVSKLKPTSYRYKMSREDTEGHGPIRYGFKAQDVLALEGIDPVIVDAEDAEKLRFNDQSMIAVLVNAIQELAAKVAALEAK